jgi:ubiquinone/menaquinone biosynthesis C-methylase UbiE
MTDTVLKLDLGCGPNKQPGHIGVDQFSFDGKVDVILNIGKEKWPWEDSSVDEIHCSHFLEHLTNLNDQWERVHFFNELDRVLKPGGKATVIFPHWCSTRYYGDPTHKEPFSEMGFYYLSKDWRLGNSPHCEATVAPGPQSYNCDLEASWGYSLHQAIIPRNAEFQQHATQWYKEAVQDIIATLKSKKPK